MKRDSTADSQMISDNTDIAVVEIISITRPIPGNLILAARDYPEIETVQSRPIPGNLILATRDYPGIETVQSWPIPGRLILAARDYQETEIETIQSNPTQDMEQQPMRGLECLAHKMVTSVKQGW